MPRLVPYPSLVGAVHQGAEVLHPAVRVRVLEQDPAHVLPTEVHLVRQLEHGLHADVAGGGWERLNPALEHLKEET